MFSICLFYAVFSMNNFIEKLNTSIYQKTNNENVINIYNNYFLEHILNELASANLSDLNPFKDEIAKKIKISFNENINSFLVISNEDLILLKYNPGLPVSIFFDENMMILYNRVFNYLIKIKRSFALIRNIELDKKLKNAINISENLQIQNLVKFLIEFRSLILNFANSLELYIFHFVIDPFIREFKEKIDGINSIDQFINNHNKFLKDIAFYLGLSNQKYLKELYDILNLIIGFPMLMNRFFMLDVDEIGDDDKQKLYIDILNSTQNFNRKVENLNLIISKIKEKLMTK